MTKKKLIMSLSLIALMAGPTWAGNQPPGPDGPGGKREPPAFAFEACEGKAVNDQVEISGPHGETFKAVCKKFKDGRLVAVPEHKPGKGPKGPGPDQNRSEGN